MVWFSGRIFIPLAIHSNKSNAVFHPNIKSEKFKSKLIPLFKPLASSLLINDNFPPTWEFHLRRVGLSPEARLIRIEAGLALSTNC